MKKILMTFLLFVVLIPFVVDAKEYCKVVKSTGKTIGNEVVCGTEHFYITDYNQNEIRMLAKYNLDVGETIIKEKIQKSNGDTQTDQQYCQELATSKGGTVKSDTFYNSPGYCFIAISKPFVTQKYFYLDPQLDNETDAENQCREYMNSLPELEGYQYKYEGAENAYVGVGNTRWHCYYKIERVIKQDENAVSAHWDDDGNYLYPQVGDVYINEESSIGTVNSNDYSDFVLDANSSDKYNGYFYDLNIGTFDYYISAKIPYNLDIYKRVLINDGIDVRDVNLITLHDINKVIKYNNPNSGIPYADWYNHTAEIIPPHYEFGSLRDLLPNDQKYLYATTYWIRTGYNLSNISNYKLGVNNVIFINSLGGVCSSDIDVTNINDIRNCRNYLKVASQLGAGLRPVITIPNELQYLISTKTDGNGTIEVVENSLGGEAIQFKVIANKGYKLGSIVIRTDSGEEVEFSEGEITKNDDGTISIDKNKFTMPFENVTIEAKWISDGIIADLLKNPKTGDKAFVIIVLMIISLGIGMVIYKRKESR